MGYTVHHGQEASVLSVRAARKELAANGGRKANSAFLKMDIEGREKNNAPYWEGISGTRKLRYAQWFAKVRRIDTKGDFQRLAPKAVYNFIAENNLWEKLGISWHEGQGIGREGLIGKMRCNSQ